jgi:alpha-amylase
VPIRFVFALHNHQPVGNFDSVFEEAYRDSYGPFLELLEQYPEIPFSLHTSGCLMEWLVERKPEYIDRLRRLVARGQAEILGGGFYEPILTMIPPRDRVGQIRTYNKYLADLFSARIRGMWVPERVWEQSLVSSIADAGVEYTVLDDYHFRQAGVEESKLFGHYVTEDDGRLLRIFPGSERMRYLVPFSNPEDSISYFGEVASRNSEAVIVFADDGEKFGSWPHTHKHCYTDGWLRRFLDQLRNNRHWIRLCTFSQALDETQPMGKVYLPDSSYREMTEWALPVSKHQAYQRLLRDMEHDQRGPEMKRFMRGGFWRNFKAKYPETEEMYGRMVQVSRRLEKTEADGDTLTPARRELYRAQCNCPWWHGAFGGLYLPHLRNAVYQHLLRAENATLDPNRRDASVEVADWDLDGAPEVLLSSNKLAVYVSPARGGSMYELDVRNIAHNVLATLSRRPEVYHETIQRHAEQHGGPGGHEKVIFKQQGLERQLQYDGYRRKSLIDHFYDATLQLADVSAGREAELGDFVTGVYRHQVSREAGVARVTMTRSGQACGASLRINKEIALEADSDTLKIAYIVENIPRDRPLHFAVEFNFAGMAAGADDRYFYHDGKPKAGQLQTLQQLATATKIGLVDEWLGLDVSLTLSRRAGIWAFPIQTVSQSEGGYELVHQSTVVMPHWLLEPDANGRWEMQMRLRLDTSRADARKNNR